MRRVPIKVVQPWHGWIVSQELVEVITHWTGTITQPCGQRDGATVCNLCVEGKPASLEAWLIVQDLRARQRPALLKLTPAAVAGCSGLLSRSGTLWGTRITVRRKGDQPRGIMTVSVSWPGDEPRLADPRSVMPELEALWAAGARRLRGDGHTA